VVLSTVYEHFVGDFGSWKLIIMPAEQSANLPEQCSRDTLPEREGIGRNRMDSKVLYNTAARALERRIAVSER
jgi:hypothetical protein